MFRSMLAIVGGVALGAWASWVYVPIHIEWPSVFVSAADPNQTKPQAAPMPRLLAKESLREQWQQQNLTAAPGRFEIAPCGRWGISAEGMEAILTEMIQRGWTPPSRSAVLALSQSLSRQPIEAVYPDRPAIPFKDGNGQGDRDSGAGFASKLTN